MNKFKVGDLIVGNSEASNRYTYTTEGWEGRVVLIRSYGIFDAESVKYPSENFSCLEQKYFDLVTLSTENKVPDIYDIF